MPQILAVHNDGTQQTLGTPHSLLTAGADPCCCPGCEACADDFNRANNANINTGAPLTWAGNTSNFSIAGGRCRTTTSSTGITACNADRVTAYITTNTSGNKAYVRLGNLYGYVTFDNAGASTLTLAGGSSTTITINAPRIKLGTRLTLCVTAYKDRIGVMLYASGGNYRVFDTKSGTFDPNAARYGITGIGTSGTIEGTVDFDNFLAQKAKGTGGLANCPDCTARPCFLCVDGNFLNFPEDPDTQCGWSVASGTWSAGTTTDSDAAIRPSDVFPPQGLDPRAVWVQFTWFFNSFNHGDAARLYFLYPGTYVELVQARGPVPGCLRMVYNNQVISSVAAPNSEGGITCYWGEKLWAVSVPTSTEAAGMWVDLEKLAAGFPGTALAVGTGDLQAGSLGLTIDSVAIRRATSTVWPYCDTPGLHCPHAFSGISLEPYHYPRAHVNANPFSDCSLVSVAGSWYTDGDGEIWTDTDNSWLQVGPIHSRARPNGWATVMMRFSGAVGQIKRVGWDANGGAPSSYVEVEWLGTTADTFDPPVRQCQSAVTNGVVRFTVFGGPGGATDPMAAAEISDGVWIVVFQICLGEDKLCLTAGHECGLMNVIFVDYAIGDFVGISHWALGVGPLLGGDEKLNIDIATLQVYDPVPDLPDGEPLDCPRCDTVDCILLSNICDPDTVLPRTIKVVVAGVTGNGPCADADCDPLDGIYFLTFDYARGRNTGSAGCWWQYLLPADGTGPAACQEDFAAIYIRWAANVTDATPATGIGIEVIFQNAAHTPNETAVVFAKVGDFCAGFANEDIPFLVQNFGSCDFSGATVTITAIP